MCRPFPDYKNAIKLIYLGDTDDRLTTKICWQRDMDKIVLVHLVTVVYNAGGATSRIGAKQSSFKVISTVKNSCSFQQQHEPPATAKLPAPKVTLVTAAVAA